MAQFVSNQSKFVQPVSMSFGTPGSEATILPDMAMTDHNFFLSLINRSLCKSCRLLYFRSNGTLSMNYYWLAFDTDGPVPHNMTYFRRRSDTFKTPGSSQPTRPSCRVMDKKQRNTSCGPYAASSASRQRHHLSTCGCPLTIANNRLNEMAEGFSGK